MPAKTATKTPKETKPVEEKKETKPAEVKVDAGSESETETKKPTKARKSKKTEESASESEADSESEKPTKKTAGRKKKETVEEAAPAPIEEEDENEIMADVEDEVEFHSSETAPFINLINGNVVEFIKKVKETEFDEDDHAAIMKAFVGLTNNFNKLSIFMMNKWFKLSKTKKGKTATAKVATPRKKVDPENVAVNRPNDVGAAFLTFMGHPDGTKLSRKDVQNYIYTLRGKDGQYTVKDAEGKALKGNPFYINKGKLGDFFKLIKNEIVSRGITDDIVIKERTKTKKSRKTGEETTTTEVDGYIHEDGSLPEYIHVNHIMKYIGYVFTKA
jgi:hypothetical protein